jgi:type IV pilus assembly protein PilM
MKGYTFRLNYGCITKMTGKLIQNVGLDLKRLLGRGETPVLGLDIGTATVKIIELIKSSSGWSVTAAGVAEIARHPASDSDDKKEVDIVGAISQCLQSAEVQTQFAVCGVCGPEVAVRSFKFPTLPPEEIEGAVLLEASQVCPFNIDESTVDYQLIPNGEEFVTGVLVAATNKLIKSKRLVAEDASLGNVLMDVDGLSLLNCFNEYEQHTAGKTRAILNVGSSYTNPECWKLLYKSGNYGR